MSGVHQTDVILNSVIVGEDTSLICSNDKKTCQVKVPLDEEFFFPEGSIVKAEGVVTLSSSADDEENGSGEKSVRKEDQVEYNKEITLGSDTETIPKSLDSNGRNRGLIIGLVGLGLLVLAILLACVAGSAARKHANKGDDVSGSSSSDAESSSTPSSDDIEEGNISNETS